MSKSDNKTTILVAVISLFSALGVAVISNFDKLFPRNLSKITTSAPEITIPNPPNLQQPSSPSSCVITVTHPLATFSQSPSHSARELGRVEQGRYKVLDNQLVNWAGVDEMWYQISYGNKLGWIQDSAILIGKKTESCP